MKPKFKILFHLPVWIVAAGFVLAKGILSPNAFAHPLFDSLQLLIVIVLWMVNFYIFYLYLVPEFLQKHKTVKFILLSIGVVCVFPVLSHYFIWFNKLLFDQPHGYSITFEGWMISGIVSVIIGGFGTFYRFATDWFYNLGLKEKMENLQLKSEIELLKSKLNPHFLFNTLNNIDTLIETEQASASLYLGKLSAILRYMVYDTANEKVGLDKEIDCIRNYIALQQLRFEDKGSVVLRCNGDFSAYQIAPALLLPLVENVFKHGDFTSFGNPAIIETCVEKGILYLNTTNAINARSAEIINHNGIGIDTTRKRLDLLYPRLYKMETGREHHMFHLYLEIDLNGN